MASLILKTHEGQVPKTLEEVWDRSPKKLVVYVMEGVGLVRLKKGAGSPFVKLSYDKQKFKTSFQKNEVDPCWKELFFFEIIDDKAELKLEVWSHSTLGSDKMIGECNVGLPSTFPREHILDSWFDLKAKPGKKVVDPNAIVGNVHLRFYYSTAPETPPRLHFTQESNFHYQDLKDKFKTGDLIVYSGIGTTHSLVKSLSGSKYSRVGMIVELPNKYTQKKKMYILEVSRNIENFLDAFDDKPICGVNLFRMDERLHGFYGTNIWWCPLKEPLEEISKHNMIDWIWDIKKGKVTIEYDDIPEEVSALMSRLELSSSRIGPLIQQELVSTKFILNALKLGGRRVPSFNKNEIIYPASVVAYQFFGEVIPLRVQNDAAQVNEDPFKNVNQGPQLSSPASEKCPEVVATKELSRVIEPTPVMFIQKKEIPKEEVTAEQEPSNEEAIVVRQRCKGSPPLPVFDEKLVEDVKVKQHKSLPAVNEKSPIPPAQISPRVSQQEKEIEDKDNMKEIFNSILLKKSLSHAKGLNDSQKKKSSKFDNEDGLKQSASVGSSLDVQAITIKPLPQKPTRPKSKSPTKVSPRASDEFASNSTGASTTQTPSTSMEKSTLAPSTTNGVNMKIGGSPKGSLEIEKTKTSNEQVSSPNGNGISFAPKNNIRNTFPKTAGEQSSTNYSVAVAPKPSPVQQRRPLPSQPKPALARLAPPTLRTEADGEDEHCL